MFYHGLPIRCRDTLSCLITSWSRQADHPLAAKIEQRPTHLLHRRSDVTYLWTVVSWIYLRHIRQARASCEKYLHTLGPSVLDIENLE